VIFTIRRWAHTPTGVANVCKNVELDPSLWATLQQWAQDNRQALLDSKALRVAHADGNHPEVQSAIDNVLDSHRAMRKQLPRGCQVDGDLWDAIMQHLVLVMDNPAMIPAPAPALATAPAKEAIAA
jgi:hypothetical protein